MSNKYCKYCGTILHNSQKLFCNNKCQQLYNKQSLIDRWLQGENITLKSGQFPKTLRDYLYSKQNGKCCRCGWNIIRETDGVCPLEIHHKDGNSSNNIITNIELICPNCHSLTDNYKSKNKNSRRKYRYKYYAGVAQQAEQTPCKR